MNNENLIPYSVYLERCPNDNGTIYSIKELMRFYLNEYPVPLTGEHDKLEFNLRALIFPKI